MSCIHIAVARILIAWQAGEDLDEDDEEKPEDEEEVAGPSTTPGPSETTPLLSGGIGSAISHSRSRSRQRRASVGPTAGNASVTQAVLMVRVYINLCYLPAYSVVLNSFLNHS